MFLKSCCQSLNFLTGRARVGDLVFICHPNIINSSDITPSSPNFSKDKQSSLNIGLLESSGGHNVWMAKRIAMMPRCLLSLISGTIAMSSSIKSFTLPMPSAGESKSNSPAEA